jgi:dipeptidyl aminopeptidase/acylaminoacyl peptidase
LQSWSEDGLAVDVLWDQPPSPISSHVDGTLIPAKPGDLTLVEGLDDTPPRPVPGLTDTELLVDASWSPDGTLIAVNITPDIDSPNSVVRIVDSTTGAVLTETDWQGSGVISMTWSTDGRFLLYTILHSTHEHTGPGSLVIHDPTTDVTTTIPLNEFVDEIRTNIGDEPG